MNNNLHFSTGNNEVETPDDFFQSQNQLALEATGQPFFADMAALKSNRKVENYYGPDHTDPMRRDSLTIDWPTDGPLWLNPPYGRRTKTQPGCYDFVQKAHKEAGINGCDVWMLLAARTDTAWWHDFVWTNVHGWQWWVADVKFIRGRLKFVGQPNCAPFPSVMVRFKG